MRRTAAPLTIKDKVASAFAGVGIDLWSNQILVLNSGHVIVQPTTSNHDSYAEAAFEQIRMQSVFAQLGYDHEVTIVPHSGKWTVRQRATSHAAIE